MVDVSVDVCASAMGEGAGYGNPAYGEKPLLDGILTNSAPERVAARGDARQFRNGSWRMTALDGVWKKRESVDDSGDESGLRWRLSIVHCQSSMRWKTEPTKGKDEV